MSRPRSTYVERVLDAAEDLIALAAEGDGAGEDARFGVFCGIVRDCAYKIRKEALRALEMHGTSEERQASQKG